MYCVSGALFVKYLSSLGIDLENIVYYKDSTHYFVMTAKKQSLLEKGVIIDVGIQINVGIQMWVKAFLSYARLEGAHKPQFPSSDVTGSCGLRKVASLTLGAQEER